MAILYRESGWEHEFDTGHIVLTSQGTALITGVRMRYDGGRVVTSYFVVMDLSREERVIFAHEILGHCTRKERRALAQQMIETLPGL